MEKTSPQRHDKSEQQDRERANLDQSGHQQEYGTDTDAQLHEESVITVRKAAKFASRVP